MLSQEEKKYYDRQLRLPNFGGEKQLLLQESKVLVIGAGGLGCPALQYMVAAGVGSITIIDDDIVDISNLHRQIIYSVDDVGNSKANVAKERLERLNPYVKIEAVVERFTVENALELVGAVDLVIDCSDNFATRYLVNDSCVIKKKPFIYGGINQFSGQLSVFNYNGGPTYRCLFPDQPSSIEAPNCSEIGVLGILPGIIGTHQALEAIKLITKMGDPLSGSLMVLDTLTHSQDYYKIELEPQNLNIEHLGEYEKETCEHPIESITYEQYVENKGMFLLDVREPYEFEIRNIGGTLIPLNQLADRFSEIPAGVAVAVLCAHGIRSMNACELLVSKGIDAHNIEGGIVLIPE